MRVLDVERLAVHGGSLLVFATPAGARRPTRDVVARMCTSESELGIDRDATYRDFATDVGRIRDELGALVFELRADGKRIAGHGVPANGNTVLEVCGFRADDLEFCTDTTPRASGCRTVTSRSGPRRGHGA